MAEFFYTVAIALIVAWLPHVISQYNKYGKSMKNLFLKFMAWVVSREFIAKWLISNAKKTHPDFVILDENGKPYLSRWWMFNSYNREEGKRFKCVPFSIRLHCFNSPDKDEHLHDHPWDAVSLIISGRYVEERVNKELAIYEAGDFNKINAEDFHSVRTVIPDETVDGDGVWTVFINFDKKKSWGFLVPPTVVPWREYLGVKDYDRN